MAHQLQGHYKAPNGNGEQSQEWIRKSEQVFLFEALSADTLASLRQEVSEIIQNKDSIDGDGKLLQWQNIKLGRLAPSTETIYANLDKNWNHLRKCYRSPQSAPHFFVVELEAFQKPASQNVFPNLESALSLTKARVVACCNIKVPFACLSGRCLTCHSRARKGTFWPTSKPIL
jgi:hypothetical protein